MERNSLGQIIVNESGSLTISILCKESTISINTYDRFLLDNKEFDELTPLIDKDSLINDLSNQLNNANNIISNLNNRLANASGSILASLVPPATGGNSGGGGGRNGIIAPL
jgi:hypothetical protein